MAGRPRKTVVWVSSRLTVRVRVGDAAGAWGGRGGAPAAGCHGPRGRRRLWLTPWAFVRHALLALRGAADRRLDFLLLPRQLVGGERRLGQHRGQEVEPEPQIFLED